MKGSKQNRRLAAIIFTDIEGYTALMQQSESRALHVRDKHRGIFDRTTEAFDGEVIHYYGDGTLSIFSSAVKSVRCAIEMQKLFQEEPAIPVRIGIHMGDIITSADDIVGDSVNLASRVESMAVAGSVLISDKVYEEIRNQEDFEVKELGTFQFKNDRSKRKIYAMVSQGLIVPEINQLKGRIEKKPDSEIATGFSIRNLKMQRILMVGLFLLIAGVFGSMYLKKVSKSRWAELEAISQIEKWSEERKYKMAFEMAMEADQYIPDDPKLDELINSISEVVSIETEPPGARVFRKLVAGNETEWENVGETPLDSILIYRGESIWRFEKGGYEPVIRLHDHEWRDPVLLFQKGQIPEEMVHVPASFYDRVLIPLIRVDSVPHVPGFLIDRFEVTNQEFKVFIDSNGYNRKEFWQHPFIRDGRILSWDEAIKLFVDKSNRPGPANWEVSDFPDGQERYPVRGISWYEAAAYAAFNGKSLPTIFHFNAVATIPQNGLIIPKSNFSNEGPVQVGIYQGIGGYGTYDLVGNVREWQYTETTNGNLRFIMGGGWSDPSYAAQDAWAQDPFDRSEINGFRCIRYMENPESREELEKPIELPDRKPRTLDPVGDDVFATYTRQFDYDDKPLNIELIKLNVESQDFRCDKVTIDAAYGNERFDIYCYMPLNINPPYQAVVIFPGAGVLRFPKYDHQLMERYVWRYLIKSGRAIICPIYKSTFDRRDGVPDGFPKETVFYKEHVIMWTKDFKRTMDYLDTRKDIDMDKIVFFGNSWGGITGGIIPAVENRIKAVILTVGGLALQTTLPEVDQLNYLPRITQPFLMLNGRYDFFFPYELSQVPMFQLVGTPIADKKHVVSETTHFFPREELVREALDWLDRYFGNPGMEE